MSRKKVFYVYALLDPRKPGYYRYGRWVFHYEPFYIGKGKANRIHLHGKKQDTDKQNRYKTRKINSIKREGYELVRVIKRSGLTEKQAHTLECTLIARVGRNNQGQGPLTNLTDGGEGTCGRIHKRKSKKQTSNSVAGSWASLKPEQYAARCKKMSEAKLRRTAKEIQQALDKKRKTLDARSSREKKAHSKRCSDAKRNMSPKARRAWIQRISDSLRKTKAALP